VLPTGTARRQEDTRQEEAECTKDEDKKKTRKQSIGENQRRKNEGKSFCGEVHDPLQDKVAEGEEERCYYYYNYNYYYYCYHYYYDYDYYYYYY
jgi:hypothetical protein